MPAIAMQVRPDLYASAIANWQTCTGRQGGEAAPDASNRDAGEARSLCICHSTTGTPVRDDKAAKPPLIPAIAMQVRRDLYVSAIAPRVHRYWTTRRRSRPLMPAIAMQVRPDLYASAIANWQTSTGTTGGEAAADARNRDGDEPPSLCIHNIAPPAHQYWTTRRRSRPLMPAIAMQVRPDLYASAIANWQTSTGTTGGEAAADARNRDGDEPPSLCIHNIAPPTHQYWTTRRRSRL